MERRHMWFRLLGFVACVGLAGCGQIGSSQIGDLLDPNPSASAPNESQTGDPSTDTDPETNNDNGGAAIDNSVRDVTAYLSNGDQEPAYLLPKDGAAIRVVDRPGAEQ